MPGPPLLLRWLLWLLLNRDDRCAVQNDLGELYQRRRARDGERAAARWLRRQLAQYPHRLLVERFRRTAPATAPRRIDGTGSRRGESMHHVFRDMQHSLRSLARTPVLAATIVLTVGLGIGATTTTFSIVHAVLIDPLPYPDSGRLVRIYTDSPPNRWPFSVADYRALNEQQASFSEVAGYRNTTMTFNREDVADRVSGKLVTANYFSLLGLAPLRGRLFVPGDGASGTEGKVMVSHGFWERYLGGDPTAIGRTLRFDGQGYTLVGVLPPEVGPLEHDQEFFAAVEWGEPPRKGPFFIRVLARVAPGVDRAAAVEELRAINRRIFPIWQASYQDERASWGMESAKEFVVGDIGATLTVVVCAVGFVLLIACTNATNLLLARATHRRRELAVRAALGASRGRLLQHLLSESALLALGGALLGLVLADGGIRLVTTAGAGFIPRTQEIGLDGATLMVLLVLTAGSALLFGLVPSLHGANTRLDQALNAGGRTASDAAGPRRLRRALVVLQFAVAAPLLIAAGLLVVSLAKLQRVDLGFDTRHVVTGAVSLPSASYPASSDVQAFWDELLTRIRALPGVEGAVLADGRPPGQVNMLNNFDLLDQPTPPSESQPVTPWVAITSEYFEVLRIPLVDGRAFDERDRRADAPPVTVVDEAWARRFYPNESAVGRQFYSGGSTTNPLTVVGVVGNIKVMGLDAPDEGTVYWPMALSGSRFRFVIARTAAEPLSALPAVRGAIRELDPTLPFSQVATIDELIADSLDAPRYLTVLVAAFGAVALLLSIVGIYGVMSYFVQQHTKDIGIRLALGGRPGTVLGMIVGRGMRLVGGGVLAGVAGAFYLTRFMSSLLFEVGTTDTATFAGVSVLMLGVALLACVIPARRAAALDPAKTLRIDDF